MKNEILKSAYFIGSARRDLRKFPKPVRDDIGFDLYRVQCGMTPATSKLLTGLEGVMELVARYNKDTYRTVYVANFGDAIYVLHCFKKKSKRGRRTPKADMDVIRQRLRRAQAHHTGA